MGFGNSDSGVYIGRDPSDVFDYHFTGVDNNADSTIQAAQRARALANAENGYTPNGTKIDNNGEVVRDIEADLKAVGPSSQGSIRYPSDTIDQESDYVLFNFYRYTPPFKTGGSNTTRRSGVNWGFGGAEEELTTAAAENSNTTPQQLLNQYNKSGVYSREEVLSPIMLYMPEDVSTSFKANWTGKAFSNLARDAMQTASADGWGKLKEAGNTLNNAVRNAVPLTGASAIRTATQKITGDSLSNDDIFGAISGVILNPNAEMLFSGMEFRNFSLNYKMVPRNEGEARAIRNIIKTFKTAMLPSHSLDGNAKVFGTDTSMKFDEMKGWDWWTFGMFSAIANNMTSVDNAFIAVPNLCLVSFMSGSGLNRNVPQYKMCAITNVDANYTPDGAWATYSDGTPVATTLNISFQETKLIFAEEAAGGMY